LTDKSSTATASSLVRQMGLLGLTATGVCSMIGAGINIIPIMIQRNVPGIGPHVLTAYALAVGPAILAALAYAILASGMPRAGGSYVYASRALHPFLGFAASFSQWFGLSIAIGVVAYVLIPFLRDIALALGFAGLAGTIGSGPPRVLLALAFLWISSGLNLLGVKVYERALVTLMFLMFIGGAVVIPTGFSYSHADFAAAVAAREGVSVALPGPAPLGLGTLMAASAILFSSFIGFDSIAQAGGEAKNPGRNLPLAIGIAIFGVATYYLLFTAAMYHAVPWSFIAERGATTDLTAPGLLGYLLSPGWTVLIVAGAAIALINDLPAMILAVSRLMFAWAEDGIFPRQVAAVNRRFRTPHVAIVASASMASASILGCHLAGDFFLGVDILIVSMLTNFLVMCVSVLTLPHRAPLLAEGLRFGGSRPVQLVVGVGGTLLLGGLFLVQVVKDLSSRLPAWYYHSTYLWLVIMAGSALLFLREWRKLARQGVDLNARFAELPPE
jgi:APA family basic amino acid/polyamine antiporter